MVSNIICHIYTRPLVFETGSKSLSRTSAKKINPLCLDAFDTDVAPLQIQMRDGSVDLQHLSQFLAECDCAMQLFDFTDDSHDNIYSPYPSPPHLGPFITAVVIFRQIDVNDRFVGLQGCSQGLTTVKNIQNNPILMSAEKFVNFNALISECLDLKEGVSIQPFSWCTTPNQNKCKFLEDHMIPKSRCSRIALKHWYYQRRQNGTRSLKGLKYLPPQLRYHTRPKSSPTSIPFTLLLIFKASCSQFF